MKPLSHDDTVLLQTLRAAAREALERKRLLGQYAVIWQDGRPAFIGPNPPGDLRHYPSNKKFSSAAVREPDREGRENDKL